MPYAHIAASKRVQIAYTQGSPSHRSTHVASGSGSIANFADLSMDSSVMFLLYWTKHALQQIAVNCWTAYYRLSKCILKLATIAHSSSTAASGRSYSVAKLWF